MLAPIVMKNCATGVRNIVVTNATKHGARSVVLETVLIVNGALRDTVMSAPSENDEVNGVLRCDEYDCVNIACSSCLLERLQEGELDCMKCIKKATPLIKQLKDENKELKNENEALCKRIQNLEESKQSLEILMYNRMGISSRDSGCR